MAATRVVFMQDFNRLLQTHGREFHDVVMGIGFDLPAVVYATDHLDLLFILRHQRIFLYARQALVSHALFQPMRLEHVTRRAAYLRA